MSYSQIVHSAGSSFTTMLFPTYSVVGFTPTTEYASVINAPSAGDTVEIRLSSTGEPVATLTVSLGAQFLIQAGILGSESLNNYDSVTIWKVEAPPAPSGHSQTIKLRKGLKANLPATAAEGEPLFATDTGELFIGTGSAVVPVIGDVNDDSISKAKLNEDVAGAGLVQDTDGSLKVNAGDGLQLDGEGSDFVSVKVDNTSVIVGENGIEISAVDGGEF